MTAEMPERFEREVADSEAEWLRLLPQALGSHPWQREASSVRVAIGEGCLAITWMSLPSRRIALLQLPTLRVAFQFDGVPIEARNAFMQHFDLHMHRGGG